MILEGIFQSWVLKTFFFMVFVVLVTSFSILQLFDDHLLVKRIFQSRRNLIRVLVCKCKFLHYQLRFYQHYHLHLSTHRNQNKVLKIPSSSINNPPPPSLLGSARGGRGDSKSIHNFAPLTFQINWIPFSAEPGNLVDHIGLLGHLPSDTGIGS